MSSETKIYINNDLDISMARMQAREAAKNMGFSTADQARISLAASELARVLSWAGQRSGAITITNASKNGHQGLQVTCMVDRAFISTEGQAATAVPNRSFAGACKLVDESSVDIQNDTSVLVTLVKWLQ